MYKGGLCKKKTLVPKVLTPPFQDFWEIAQQLSTVTSDVFHLAKQFSRGKPPSLYGPKKACPCGTRYTERGNVSVGPWRVSQVFLCVRCSRVSPVRASNFIVCPMCSTYDINSNEPVLNFSCVRASHMVVARLISSHEFNKSSRVD